MAKPHRKSPAKPEAVSFTENSLLILLAQANAHASKTFHKELQKSGISVSTWRILASLYPNETLTVSALADKCLLKQPTLTRTLDRLQNDDLVQRLHSTKDRRSVLIKLTRHGRDLAARKVVQAKAHEDCVLADYGVSQVSDLKKSLHDFINKLA